MSAGNCLHSDADRRDHGANPVPKAERWRLLHPGKQLRPGLEEAGASGFALHVNAAGETELCRRAVRRAEGSVVRAAANSRCGEYVGPTPEIVPLMQSNLARSEEMQSPRATGSDGQPDEEIGPRAVYSKRTGLPVVVAKPGQRMVTSEDIYEELRGSGP
jgi:hypothetical protein